MQVLPAPDLSEVSVTALAERLSQLPEVEQVIRDTRWLARLQEALLAGWRWVTAIGVAMVLGAVLALVNTLYLAIDARREEIEVASLIGGSPLYPPPISLHRTVFRRRWWCLGGPVFMALQYLAVSTSGGAIWSLRHG